MTRVNSLVIAPKVVAEAGLRQLVAKCLKDVGFDHVEAEAMDQLEEATLTLLTGLAHLAQGLATVGRRRIPNVRDALAACEDQGLNIDELRETLSLSAQSSTSTFAFLPPIPEPVEPWADYPALPLTKGLTPLIRERLSIQPDFLPPLPPVHSFRDTAVYPAKTTLRNADTSQLDAKMQTSRLIQASLRHLVEATTNVGNLNGKSKPSGPVRGASQPRLTITLGKRNELKNAEQTAIINWETFKGTGKRKSENIQGDERVKKVKLRWRM